MLSSEIVYYANTYNDISTFPTMWFSVYGFLLSSWIYLNFIFMQGGKYGCICILLHVDIHVEI